MDGWMISPAPISPNQEEEQKIRTHVYETLEYRNPYARGVRWIDGPCAH